MRDETDIDIRHDALVENFALLRARASEGPGQAEAEALARMLDRCARRMGLSPSKDSIG